MSQKMFVAVFATLLCFGVNSFAQEKSSPISPSDIPIDQIKNAAQIKADQEKAAQQAAAKTEETKAAVKPAAKPKDKVMKEKIAPTPSAEGTAVKGTTAAEPCCGCSATPTGRTNCQPAGDPCSSRGKFMSRIRSMFQRRCCQ